MTCSFSFSCTKCCLSSQTTQKSERRDGSRIQPQPGVAHERSVVPNAFKGAPAGAWDAGELDVGVDAADVVDDAFESCQVIISADRAAERTCGRRVRCLACSLKTISLTVWTTLVDVDDDLEQKKSAFSIWPLTNLGVT